MTFGERIKNLRREKQWTQERVAEKLNISVAAICRYESGMYEPKSLSILNAFADLYDVSTDFLLGKSPYKNMNEFLFQNYNNSFKDKLEKTLDYMENNSIQTMFMIPLYSKLIDENDNDKFLQGYIPISPELYNMDNPDRYLYLLVNDDSINLKVKRNDFALVQKQNQAIDGDIVLVTIDKKETIFRKWKKINEQFILLEPISARQDVEPILLDLKQSQFRIIGKVIGHFGKIN